MLRGRAEKISTESDCARELDGEPVKVVPFDGGGVIVGNMVLPGCRGGDAS